MRPIGVGEIPNLYLCAEFDFNIEMNCVKNIENFSIVLIESKVDVLLIP